MGDPRNPARVEEEWDPKKLEVLIEEAKLFGKLAVLSGGYAWHFMSPPHRELKILHDHKDIDIFVDPIASGFFFQDIQAMGYKRIWSRYDQNSNNFYRYEKHISGVKVIVDVFLKRVDSVKYLGLNIINPDTLIKLYRDKVHTTDDCLAVQKAKELSKQGICPIGRQELVGKWILIS